MSSGFSDAELINEINALRTNPRRYACKVLNYKTYFKGNVLHIPGAKVGIETKEGPSAYTEAGDFLGKHSRIEALTPSKGLCKIAQKLLEEIQKGDANDLNRIDMEKIIAKYGKTKGDFSRAIDFGSETPEQVIVNLVVDDGDKSREQRQSLLCTDFKKVGVANGIHPDYGLCTVIVSCNTFENNKDEDDTEDFENNNYRNEGNMKSKKVMVNKGNNDRKLNKKFEEELPPGCVELKKSETIVIEGGKKKKVIKIIKIMEDGSKEVETLKESIEE